MDGIAPTSARVERNRFIDSMSREELHLALSLLAGHAPDDADTVIAFMRERRRNTGEPVTLEAPATRPAAAEASGCEDHAVTRISEPFVPRRGDDVEQWLRGRRDVHGITGRQWAVHDDFVIDYQAHADAGLPLSEPLPARTATGAAG